MLNQEEYIIKEKNIKKIDTKLVNLNKELNKNILKLFYFNH